MYHQQCKIRTADQFANNLMLIIFSFIIIILSLYSPVCAGGGNVGDAGHCVDYWSYVGQVAVSVRPDFSCHYSTFTSTMSIEKHSPAHYSYVNIESNIVTKSDDLFLKITTTDDALQMNNMPVNLTLFHETSQGLAKLPVMIRFALNPNKAGKYSTYQIYFKPLFSNQIQTMNSYEISWDRYSGMMATTAAAASDDEEDILLVYNTTHLLQYNTNKTSVCLNQLTQGQIYQICVVRSSLSCRQSQWSCISQTIPVLFDNQAENTPIQEETIIGLQSLRMVSSGSDWAQLAWLPTLQSRTMQQFEFPDAYMIVVTPKKVMLDRCLTRIYTIQAPWIQTTQLNALRQVVETARLKFTTNCSSNTDPGLMTTKSVVHSINQLGQWPDWHKFIEQFDEWGGLLNEFTVNLNNLQPNQLYEVSVSPITVRTKTVQTSISVLTKSRSTDCHLELISTPNHEAFLNWTVPPGLNSTILNKITYGIEILHVGRPERDLQQTCFMSQCKSNDHHPSKISFISQSTTTMNSRLQIVKCFNTKVKNTNLIIPCLAKCRQFEIIVSSYNDNVLLNEFVCKKRFVLSGKDPQSSIYARALSISQNILLLQLNKLKSNKPDYCPISGYTLQFKPMPSSSSASAPASASSSIDNQLLFTTDDLISNLTRFKYDTVDVADGSVGGVGVVDSVTVDRHHILMLNVPTRLYGIITTLSIQTIGLNSVNKINLRVPLISKNCYLDCIWPNQLAINSFNENSNYYYYDYNGYRTNVLNNYHISNNNNNKPINMEQCQATLITNSDQQFRSNRCRSVIPSPINTINNHLSYSEYTFCNISNQIKTCFIPHCDMMAPLPCVTFINIMDITHSSVRIEWRKPEMDTQFYKQYQLSNDLIEINAYLVVIYRLWSVNQTGLDCVDYQFVFLYEDHPDVEQLLETLIIGSLIHNCRQSQSKFVVAPLNHLFYGTQFQNLTHNTTYQVTILPINKLHQLGSGWTEEFATIPARPCKPESVTIAKTESHALTLQWKLSNDINCGQPTELFIHYTSGTGGVSSSSSISSSISEISQFVNQPDTIWMTIKLPYNLDKFRLASLHACHYYCVRVQLRNNVGTGIKSDILCGQTDQAPFTHLPRLTVQTVKPNRYVDSEVSTTAVDVQFNLNHTRYCALEYKFVYGIYNSTENFKLTSSQPSLRISKNIRPGLLYRIRGQAVSVGRSGRTESQWTDNVQFYVNMSHWSLINFTAEASKPNESPTNSGELQYFCPSSMKFRKYSDQLNKTDLLPENSVCLQLHWNVTGSMQGLLGLLMQIYVHLPRNQSSIQDIDVNLAKNRQTDAICTKFIWFVCSNCSFPFSFNNAHPRVFGKLQSLMRNCESKIGQYSQLNSIQNRPIQQQQPYPYYSINLDQTYFNYEIAVLIPTSDVSTEQLIDLKLVKRYDYRMMGTVSTSSTPPPSSLSSTTTTVPSPIVSEDERFVHNGFVSVYVVTMNDVELNLRQDWNLFMTPNSSIFTSTILITLLVLSIIIFWLLVCLFAVLIIFNIQQRSRLRKQQSQYETNCEDDDDRYELRMDFKLPVIPLRIGSQPDSIHINDFVNWFSKHSGNNSTVIYEQFQLLKLHSYQQEHGKRLTCIIGQSPENRLRNRYRNLLPFDQNYVHLKQKWQLPVLEHLFQTNGSETDADDDTEQICSSLPNIGPEQWTATDYVNASFIPTKFPGITNQLNNTKQLTNAYIAAQAPVIYSRTVFWQMIWDHEIKLIVMLTCPIENDKEKCVVYWPTLSTTEIIDPHLVRKDRTIYLGRFEIYLIEEVSYCIYVKRKMKIVDLRSTTKETRFVTQLHMLKWPDFSTPTTKDFILFLHSYWTEKHYGKIRESPVLVHCSAGVGRTGTFITLDQLCQHVRMYLQPDYQFLIADTSDQTEPMYANLKTEAPYTNLEELTNLDSSKLDSSVRQFLLGNSTPANGVNTGAASFRKRKFLFGRNNSSITDENVHFVNIYKIVFWLRGHRTRMVQTYEQYRFIFECLSAYIQQLKDTDQIYENI